MGSLSRQVRFKPHTPLCCWFFFPVQGKRHLSETQLEAFPQAPAQPTGQKPRDKPPVVFMSPRFSPKIFNLLFPSSLPGCHLTTEQAERHPPPRSWLPYISVKNIPWRLLLVQHKPNHFIWLLQPQNTPVPARILNKACLSLAARLKKCHFLLKMKQSVVISGLH